MRFLVIPLGLLLSGCVQRDANTLRLTVFAAVAEPHIAQSLGLFEKEALKVEVTMVPGTARAMESLLGGSADAIVGTYEQALQVSAQGKSVQAFQLFNGCHCLALVASPAKPEIQTVGDLAGKVVGVGAAGGAMQNFAQYLLDRSGVTGSFASVGIGASAVAALEGGRVDAAVLLYNPMLAMESRHGGLRVLAETFSAEGSRAVFGVEQYPAQALMAEARWLGRNPAVARRLVRALSGAVQWMRAHTAREIRARLPDGPRTGDEKADLATLEMLIPRYSSDGRFRLEEAAAVRKVLGLNVDVRNTFRNDLLP